MEIPSVAQAQEDNGNSVNVEHMDTDPEHEDENDEGNTNNNHQHHPAVGSLCSALGLTSTPRGSVEDLSEYTDADESISSAPTEFLAEVSFGDMHV
jgi:hypothetical protein